jgi:cytoskeletal protein CcmA (bactofilin family)
MDQQMNPEVPAESSGTPMGEKTIIAQSFAVEGELVAKEDTLIQGRVDGSIVVEDHTARIGRQAQVTGEVFAKNVTVEGKIDGEVSAKETVALRRTAEVKGKILAPQVEMEEGCQFNGEVKMDKAAISVASTRAGRKQKRASK